MAGDLRQYMAQPGSGGAPVQLGRADQRVDKSTNVGYLHDGRARSLTEAIIWHDGEAAQARARFAKLAKADRDAILAFLRSLLQQVHLDQPLTGSLSTTLPRSWSI